MRVLMYCWGAVFEDGIRNEIENSGNIVDAITFVQKGFFQDSRLTEAIKSYFIQLQNAGEKCDCAFSMNYVPAVSCICEEYHVRYISWMSDCPSLSIYSDTITNNCNYIFSFDYTQTKVLQSLGAKHCYNMTLAADMKKWDSIVYGSNDNQKYASDITFLGTLYNSSTQDLYSQIAYLPESLRGYLDAVIKAQEKIYGYNFISEILSEEIIEQISQYIHFDKLEGFDVPYNVMIQNLINAHIARLERQDILNAISCNRKVTLYTGSELNGLNEQYINNKGYADYYKDMPKIFRSSKVNLNITAKGIQSGIPQRVFDIMGNRGFLISNFQPELAENFVDGEELVLYESEEDLLHKIDYYLEHEEEREKIALAGYEKVRTLYSLERKIAEIFTIAWKIPD